MDDNVTQFPTTPSKPPQFLVGPFEEYRIVIDGRCIPRLTGSCDPDGKFWLVVDGRLASYFSSEEDAYQAAVLAANAMAVGAGYPFSSAESRDRPFAPKMNCIGSVSTDAV